MTTNEMYQQLGISPEVLDFGQRVLDGLDKEMSRVDPGINKHLRR